MITERTFFWKSAQVIARLLTTVLFDLKVYGLENVPKKGGVLIVSNHQGNLDPVLLGVRLNRPLNYIAKSELFENPLASWVLRALNAFPVRQGAGDIGAVRETIHRLQEGHLLNLFPEGARTVDGEIGPLLKGVALIVRRAKVPVVPAAIVGSYEAWPIHRKMFRRRPIHVQYGPPMNLAGLETDDQIVALIDQTLHRMFNELRSSRNIHGPAHQHQPAEMRSDRAP